MAVVLNPGPVTGAGWGILQRVQYMEDKEFDFLWILGPREEKEGLSLQANYYIPVPSHKHLWKRRRGYLETEARCFYTWDYRGVEYRCYATYIQVPKLNVWQYAVPGGQVETVSRFPRWYESEII